MSEPISWRGRLRRWNNVIRTGGLSLRERDNTEERSGESAALICYVCGKVLDSPPTGHYPTREECERQTTPAMAMVRAMEVMEVHTGHG